MLSTRNTTILFLAALAGATLAVAPDTALAQATYYADSGYVSGYTYHETTATETPLLFGVAAYKLCQIKSFLFAGVYVLGAIAFVIFAIRALFTKFEFKHFLPIIGSLFVVASADLFIYWMSEDAYFCPTTLATFGG